MTDKKKEKQKDKFRLHPRNMHRERYDFKQLTDSCPELIPFVTMNIHNEESIDFSNQEAVRMLNKAIMKFYYGIDSWNIPSGYICPPIQGRADYIHHIADILGNHNQGKVPTGNQIKCMDVGVGASCVYPIIGNSAYGWSFVGADIDTVSIESGNTILEANPILKENVELRWQKNIRDVFYGMIQRDELFDLSICNPPFHDSLAESETTPDSNNSHPAENDNFTPKSVKYNSELCCEGGEERFLKDMIRQSKNFAASCLWFSTLVLKQSHLKNALEALQNAKATEVKNIPLGQGNKAIHMIAWTFQSWEKQKEWMNARWNEREDKEVSTSNEPVNEVISSIEIK